MLLLRRLFVCAAVLLVLPLLPVAVRAADTPAVAVVRQFLADRAAGDAKGAYTLLSAPSRQGISPQGFAADLPAQYFTPGPWSDPNYGVTLLFKDPKNTQHATYAVIGADPEDPVLVRISWTDDEGDVREPLRLRTVTDPATKAVRVDMLGSVQASFPPVPPGTSRQETNQFISDRNLTVLAFALLQYARSHQNRFPDAAHWTDALPFVEDKSLFHDPSAPASQHYSYAFNRNLSHQPLFAIPYPGLVVLLYQSTRGGRNAADTGQFIAPAGPHNRGTNYAYVDGDAESISSFAKDDANPSFKLSGKR